MHKMTGTLPIGLHHLKTNGGLLHAGGQKDHYFFRPTQIGMCELSTAEK